MIVAAASTATTPPSCSTRRSPASCSEQEQRAHELLTKHRRGLELIAEALLEKETIDGSEVNQLVQAGLGDSEQPHPSESTVN